MRLVSALIAAGYAPIRLNYSGVSATELGGGRAVWCAPVESSASRELEAGKSGDRKSVKIHFELVAATATVHRRSRESVGIPELRVRLATVRDEFDGPVLAVRASDTRCCLRHVSDDVTRAVSYNPSKRTVEPAAVSGDCRLASAYAETERGFQCLRRDTGSVLGAVFSSPLSISFGRI